MQGLEVMYANQQAKATIEYIADSVRTSLIDTSLDDVEEGSASSAVNATISNSSPSPNSSTSSSSSNAATPSVTATVNGNTTSTGRNNEGDSNTNGDSHLASATRSLLSALSMTKCREEARKRMRGGGGGGGGGGTGRDRTIVKGEGFTPYESTPVEFSSQRYSLSSPLQPSASTPTALSPNGSVPRATGIQLAVRELKLLARAHAGALLAPDILEKYMVLPFFMSILFPMSDTVMDLLSFFCICVYKFVSQPILAGNQNGQHLHRGDMGQRDEGGFFSVGSTPGLWGSVNHVMEGERERVGQGYDAEKVTENLATLFWEARDQGRQVQSASNTTSSSSTSSSPSTSLSAAYISAVADSHLAAYAPWLPLWPCVGLLLDLDFLLQVTDLIYTIFTKIAMMVGR